MNQAFGLFAHVNVAPTRHLPQRHQVRGRDHRHDAGPPPRRGHRRTEPVGLVTTGGTGSICHAMLAYREDGAQERASADPT